MSAKTKISIFQRGGYKRHGGIEYACRWALAQLLSTRMANTLNIRIEIRSTKLKKGTLGLVRTASNGSKATKNFTIVLHRDHSLREQLETLFHEVAHVAQFAMGRLQQRHWKSDRKLHYRWEGQEMGAPEENPYWDRPWEVEARRVESELNAKWKQHKIDLWQARGER